MGILVIAILGLPNFVSAPKIPYEQAFEYVQNSAVVAHTTPSNFNSLTLGSLIGNEGDLSELIRVNNPKIWAVIQCESHWDNSRIGKAGEIGLAQFMPKTWKWMSKISGFYGDINNAEDQVSLMIWAWNNGYQNHWVCYKKLF